MEFRKDLCYGLPNYKHPISAPFVVLHVQTEFQFFAVRLKLTIPANAAPFTNSHFKMEVTVVGFSEHFGRYKIWQECNEAVGPGNLEVQGLANKKHTLTLNL